MPLYQRVTLYADNDTTVLAVISTDPAHASPYLFPIEQRGEASVNFVEGSSSIGQIVVEVLDKRTNPVDQNSGWFTNLIPDAAGYNRLMGRRLVAEEQLVAGGAYVQFFDGVMDEVVKESGERMVIYRIPCRDIRERERATPIFTKVFNRYVLPWGVAEDYGQVGNGSEYIVPAAPPITFQYDAGLGDLVSTRRMKFHGVTPERFTLLQNLSRYTEGTGGPRHRGIKIEWRPVGGGAWTAIEDFPFTRETAFYRRTAFGKIWESHLGLAIYRTANASAPGPHPVRPVNGQIVEVRVSPRNVAPSDDIAIYFERNAGELVRECYDGAHSDYPMELLGGQPLVRYDSVAMNAMIARTGKVRVKITQKVPNMRDWLEENIYKPHGYAPIIDRATGKVVPTRYELPDINAPLLEITDSVVRDDARWTQPKSGAINSIKFTYIREYLTEDEETDDKIILLPLDRLREQKVTNQRENIASVATLGRKDLVYEPVTIRSAASAANAGAPNAEHLSEAAFSLSEERQDEAKDRFLYGDQRIISGCRRSATGVNAAKIGDWAHVSIGWLPELGTGRLGTSRLMQVVRIEETDAIWRTFEFSDAGPFAQPAAIITLGAPSLVAGQLQVTVTNVPAGVIGHVQYAVGDTQPAADSSEWQLIGMTTVSGTVLYGTTYSAGERIWVRGRGEIVGRRRSLWTTAASVLAASTPTIFRVTVTMDDTGVPTVGWRKNSIAGGVKVRYRIQMAGVDHDGVWDATLDANANDLQMVLSGVQVPAGRQITVQVTPYAGFAAGVVTGAAGAASLNTAVASLLPTVGAAIVVSMIAHDNDTVTYQVSAVAADGGVATLFYGYGDDPVTIPLVNPGNIVVTRATNEAPERLIRVRAVTATGLESRELIVVDFDILPEVIAVSAPQPTFVGTSQVGWALRGAVDDDTRGLKFTTAEGVTLASVVPNVGLIQVSATEWWANVGVTKTWVLEVTQSAGARGTVTITPTEFFSTAVPGLIGQPYSQVLSRAPVTVISARELTSMTREVTISVTPVTATISYRLTQAGVAGQWQEVSNASGRISFTAAVGSGDALVEFYGKVGTIQEDVQRFVLDQDTLPEISSSSLVEESANILRLALTFDDDVVAWRAWARRNATPLDSFGQPQQPYLRYDGGVQAKSIDFRAGGNGDGTSTWTVVVRAYNSAGEYVQATLTKLVSGAAAAIGSLSGVQAQSVDHAGVKYIDLLWNHNQSAVDTAHTVTIRENGVQLVAGRDVAIEHDGGVAVSLVGGYHVQRAIVPAGTAGAVETTFAYQIDLIRTAGAVLLNTYAASITVWITGGGGGGGGAAPTETPATLICESVAVADADAYWTNTNSTASVRIEWHSSSTQAGAYALASTHELLPAVAEHSRTFAGGTWVKFRVQYYNANGAGPWSAYSTPAIRVKAEGDPL